LCHSYLTSAMHYLAGDIMHKILILDDRGDFSSRSSDEPTGDHYEVITVCDGKLLLKVVSEQNPEFIVLEIKTGNADLLNILHKLQDTGDYHILRCQDTTDLQTKIKMAIKGRLKFLSTDPAENKN
jgi:DNA-binding NtrC family response regulator